MITLVEALNYRCLRHISQPLGPFHVLVGPNASGKTTFLDVIAFLGRLVSDGPDAAIEERTQSFYDLVWQREGTQFELAIEARIPEQLRHYFFTKGFDTVRYEAVLVINPKTQAKGVQSEQVYLLNEATSSASSRAQLLNTSKVPTTIWSELDPGDSKTLLKRYQNIGARLPGAAEDWILPAYLLAPQRSVLRRDEPSLPVIAWLSHMLTSGVQQISLNSLLLRKPSPPGQGQGFRPDGSNLPWVVADLRQRSPERFRQWVAHLRTTFPDLEDLDTIERPEDRHRYLVLQYSGGLKVPSWMASDGTLRMLALTLPAYLEDFKGIYLIEEPENGIHPRAIETMTQSLSSVYNAQVLMATHSPVVLSTVEAEQILCFSKNAEGATEIVRGSEHPALREWKHETTLGTLFAAGVLG